LVLGISQSGKSPDIVAVLAEARRQGALTAAFTNTPDSALAAQADHVIALAAGPERSVAATKTYTASLAAIGLFSATLSGDSAMATALARVPDAVARVLRMAPDLKMAVERYRYMEHCVVIGRGYNYATAFEWALKIKELTYTVVEAYSSADFLHGPLALLERGFPVFVLAPGGPMTAELEGFVARALRTKAEVIAISDREAILKQARVALPLPVTVPAWLSPLTTIVPGQLFAMYLAATRGYDVDEPRALQKVTKTL
jgi:glucosamine--fructose-6-phosphate aminotransferase (isomerizing)